MIRYSIVRTVSIVALLSPSLAFAQQVRTILPIPDPTFQGTVREYAQDSSPDMPPPVRAPAGAPNVLVFMSDDAGFSLSRTFGGLVPTPNMDRLARIGVRYNRFHTTGICSPSRAALLTGRNHHNATVGYLAESGFPGYYGRIPASTATIAQTLRLNGYSTAMFGKHHNTPTAESSAVGPFDHWPTGLGFEHFYGFIDGYADQYSPVLYRGTEREPTPQDKTVPLDRRLADDAIHWIHNQKAGAPDKPFFIYYAPGSTHVPLQAPASYIDRFKGKFDNGWDEARREIYQQQLRDGVIPRGTKLTPRPADIQAWSSLPPERQAFFARTMEVAAGMLAYQDEQFGRVIDELDRMGELDNTLVIFVQGDNGGSAESGNEGAVNEMYRTFGGPIPETITPELLQKLGGPETHPATPAGWAWAMDTPFPGVKQFASMLGGIRNGMIMSWPARARPRAGTICSEFGHLVDIAPTVLDATRIPAPEVVYGAQQKPLDGISLLDSLNHCQPEKPRTQYFELAGKAGLYHDGWFASREDGRSAWQLAPPGGGNGQIAWTLYDLRSDFSQSIDLSARYPERMQAMIALWESEAKRNHVYPLLHRFAMGRYEGAQLRALAPAPKPIQFWGKDTSVPVGRLPADRSFTLSARLAPASAEANGVIVAAGSHFSGWSLYLDRGHPTFAYGVSPQAQDRWKIAAKRTIGQTESDIRLSFWTTGRGQPAQVQILDSQGQVLADGTIPRTYVAQTMGETLDVGIDTGVPVTTYANGNGEFEGEIGHVGISFDTP